MTLVDTSVWIEFLRGTDTPAAAFVREHLGIDLGTTEPVMMELLAGARPGPQAERIESLLLSQRWHRVDPTMDYRGAVEIYWAARAVGRQPRGLADCLIAAVALRLGLTVVSRDVDFMHLGDATGLSVRDLR